MHNGTIIATVSERAENSYKGDLLDAKGKNGQEGFKRWYDHWMAEANLWAAELRAEGLNKTADTLDKHIDWFKRNLQL